MISVLSNRPGQRHLALTVLLTLTLPACHVKEKAMRSAVDAMTSGPSSFGRDDDPELIREAIPFGLVTLESLHKDMPDHAGLNLALCSGYTQYAYAFVQLDADLLKYDDYDAYRAGRERAHRLYKRAFTYCEGGLNLLHPEFVNTLRTTPSAALEVLSVGDVTLTYWSAAAWGGAISTATDGLTWVADLPQVRSLAARGLELDEDFDSGAFHELFVSLDMAPAGAGADSARAHFQRALELSQGHKAGPYVGFAEAVLVPEQNRDEFTAMMDKALAINPDEHIDYRLVNLLTQKRARFLQAHLEDLFGG